MHFIIETLKSWVFDKKNRKEKEERRKHYVIKYIDKNDSLCLKILKGDDGLAKELQDGNQSYTGADNEDQ